MSAPDLVFLGFSCFLAGTLACRLLLRGICGRHSPSLPSGYRERHAGIQEWLERRNILRIPGVFLVCSVRPWVVGESATVLSLVAAWLFGEGILSVAKALPAAAVLGAGTGFLSLRREARRALISIRKDLPVACFLLSLLLEGGMGPSAALQETAAALPPGPLSRELGELVRARSLGVPRGESLNRSRDRVPCEEYRLFLNHVRQGERLGIGLSRSLRELSAKMLESRRDQAETMAQQAAVKMLAPLVLFIFPAVFLIILSPVLFGLWGRLRG